VHQIIVNLTGSSDSYLSAMACHVIYIASFAIITHSFTGGAVSHLADLVRAANTNTTVNTRSDNGRTDHVAAAMAKYGGELCATVSDGRCYWDWTTTASDSNANSKWRYQGSLPLLIDGSKVRYEMLSDGALVERLVQLTCQDRQERSQDNPFRASMLSLVNDDFST
jgi:hypothetical protein